MTQPERGLFEQIRALLPSKILHSQLLIDLHQTCLCHDIAYHAMTNAMEHERKYLHKAQDRISDLEQRLAEANSTIEDLRLIEREKTDHIIASYFVRTELQNRLAEVEAKLAQAQSIVAQKDLALAAANELLARA